jgi:hypothetical protein
MARNLTARKPAPWRIAVVCTLALFVGALTLPDSILPWHPFATFGFETDAGGRVQDVTPGSAAERAGIHAGDRIDVGAADLSVRRAICVSFMAAPAGAVRTFPIIDPRGRRHDVTLTAEVRARSLADNVADVVQNASFLVFLIAGSALVLLRPSGLTWAFFWYALATCGGSVLVGAEAPLPIAIPNIALSFLEGLAWLPFVIFALRFPTNVVTGWRAIMQRTLLASLFVLVPLYLYEGMCSLIAAPYYPVIGTIIFQYSPGFGFVLGTVIFAITYAGAAAADRPRLRWVIAGFLFGYGGLVIQNVLSATGLATWPIWLTDLVQTLDVAVPLSVGYAIFKHRVIDVQFYLNRALVYGLLTTAVIVVVALLHWIVSKQLEEFHFGILIEVLGVLAVGVSLQKLHGLLDRLVDRFVFRSVHDAEQHLNKIAASLMYAQGIESLDRMICVEPLRALHLAGGAVYRSGDGSSRYDRQETSGVYAGAPSVERDDPFVLEMFASKAPVDTADSIAFPFLIRDEVVGFALYGPHTNGSSIDPNEREIVERFVTRATSAYDHFTSKSRAVEIARLRTENETLKSLVSIREPSGSGR